MKQGSVVAPKTQSWKPLVLKSEYTYCKERAFHMRNTHTLSTSLALSFVVFASR